MLINNLKIRAGTAGDLDAIEQIYRDTFPDEDLVPLLRDLMQLEHDVLSRVGVVDTAIIAQVIFTRCRVGQNNANAALLGPLAVTPAMQRQGVGSQIVRDGFTQLQDEDIGHVYVLGDPAYYSRLGFVAENAIKTPYRLPAEWSGAWQSIRLDNATDPGAGAITLPQPWMRKELWST